MIWNSYKNFFFIVLAAVFLVTGCTRNSADITDEIQTLAAVKGNVSKTVTFIGNITGGQSSSLVWSTNGVIDAVNVKLGDTVAEGQVLASLERNSLSSDVINAEIPLISALDEMEEVLSSETPKAQAYKDLKDKESELVKSEKAQESLKYPRAVTSDIKYWSEQVTIYRQYYEEALETFNDAVSWRKSTEKGEHDIYEQRRKNMLTALNNYAEVYNNYLYYSGHASENDIAQAAANIDVARAAYDNALKVFNTYSEFPREKDLTAAQLKVENAENTYNRRNIVASINGVVTQINARPGDYVTKNTAAFRLDNTEHLYVPMDVSEIDVNEIHDGMKAKIVLDSNTSKTYDGVVKRIAAHGTSSGSRVTFQTMVEILEPDENVKIGMTAEVSLILQEAENVLIVPANAVFSDEDTTYVGVYRGESCNDVPVTVGLVSDTVAEIRGGYLSAGDAVCVPSVSSSIIKDMGLDQEKTEKTADELLIGGTVQNDNSTD